MICDATIPLANPIRAERVRDFQLQVAGFPGDDLIRESLKSLLWRTVYVYACPKCGTEYRVRASCFVGKNPVPSTGAIRCGKES